MPEAYFGAHAKDQTNPEENLLRIKVLRAVVALDYNGDENEHDIALLELEEPVRYNDFIKPICVPETENYRPLNSSQCIAAGWGKVDESKSITSNLIYFL